MNLGWLSFIVVLPFVTTLVSANFYDTPAVFACSYAILMISVFQNFIWDYIAKRPEFIKNDLDPENSRMYKIACNAAMINAVAAIAFFVQDPVFAFAVLFLRTISFWFIAKQYRHRENRIRRRNNQ